MNKQNAFFTLRVILIIFVVILSGAKIYAQSTEDRVKEIRKMYADVNQFHKAGRGFDCQKGSTRNRAEVEYSNEIYTQRANRCYYPNSYSKLSLNFEGWEWAADGEYYYKDGRLFFVYLVMNTVCGKRTYRLYYNTSGRIIRLLQQADDCSEEVQGKNVEIYSSSEIRDISDDVNKYLRRAQSMIN
jgi:hypothetical protein